MKKEDLKQIIRELVKEEVSNQVNKAMGKIVVELLKEVKRPAKKSLVESVLQEEEEQELPEPVQENSRVAIIKTANPKLAAVLAETARNFTPLQRTDDGPVASVEGGFDKIGKGSKLDYIKQMVNESIAPSTPSVLDNAAVPAELNKVFKKDFRSLMKKMDEVKKNGGSGMINPTSLISG